MQADVAALGTLGFALRLVPHFARLDVVALRVEAAHLLAGKTVMIVDDNETNRRILETMLGQWGLKTISADSGAKALATLDRSINAGQAIAPGQIPAAAMLDEFRFRAVNPRTRLFGVVSSSAMHSLSPALHNAAVAQNALAA